MARKKNTIYVQIASYRDPELIPTIKDCIEKAKYPGNLRFGIAWQHSPYDEFDDISEYKDDNRFRIIDIDYRDAKGVPYARNLLNKAFDGEKYTMQLDSHHRFAKNWDVELIKMLEGLRKDGYEKPLLSSYVPSYDPSNDPDGRVNEPWIMEFDRFAPEGPAHFLPHTIDEYKELDKPVRSRFISGHFIFADGIFCQEVEYDPNYYFHGEEINLSVRAYMAGYDLFAPHRVFVWHEYLRDGKVKHWDDHTDWVDLDKVSHAHGRKVLGMSDDPTEVLKGNVRSLRDYEIYAGLEFSTRRVHQKTIEKVRAPVSEDDISHQSGLLNYRRVCIDLYNPDFQEEDYNVWVVAFEDENGNEFHREDADVNEIRVIRSVPFEQDNFYHIWRTFYSDQTPHKWIVWPHSESKGWMDRVEGIFNVG